MKLGESGVETVKVLLGVSSAFAEITDAIGNAERASSKESGLREIPQRSSS